MDEIKLYVETVCLVSIFASLAGAAIPQGKMKSAFSAFCAAVFIFSIASPLADIKPQGLSLFSFASEERDEMLLSNVSTAQAELFENMLEDVLEAQLEKAGYTVTLEVSSEKKDDEFEVSSFTVRGAADEKARAEIEAYLKKSFSDATVNFEEDGNGSGKTVVQ